MAPFDNNDVRLALKYAIDRQDIVDKILRGCGEVGNDHPIPSFDPFYAADIPQHEYDPDQAKHHFQKSGASGPITMHISNASFTGAVYTAVLTKHTASRAGITTIIEPLPEPGYVTEVWETQPSSGS